MNKTMQFQKSKLVTTLLAAVILGGTVVMLTAQCYMSGFQTCDPGGVATATIPAGNYCAGQSIEGVWVVAQVYTAIDATFPNTGNSQKRPLSTLNYCPRLFLYYCEGELRSFNLSPPLQRFEPTPTSGWCTP